MLPCLFKFGLDLILHEAVPDRPVLKYWVHRWKVIHLLRVIFSSVLFEVLKWVCLVKESCFGCALLYLFCPSFPVFSTFETKKFYRNLSQKTKLNVCFASLNSRSFGTELRTEGCFCENVFRCGFLFVLNAWDLLLWNISTSFLFKHPDSEDMSVPMNTYWGRKEQTVKFYFYIKYKNNCKNY